MTFQRAFLPAALLLLASLTAGCGRGNASAAAHADGSLTRDTVELTHARNLHMVLRSDGCVEVNMRNPWDTACVLARYLLVPHNMDAPDAGEGVVTVRIPLKRAVVYSTVHMSLADELGAIEAVKGVCDVHYLRNGSLRGRVSNGEIADCGNSQAPAIERVVALAPDAILLSPYENSGTHGKVTQLGIPVILCADYMEPTPLGRAEWMKLFGVLWGKQPEADRLWGKTLAEYNSIRCEARKAAAKDGWPRVLTETPYGGVWYAPAADSTMGRLIADAGGVNPFAASGGCGSLPLSAEVVVSTALDADVWLIRYFQPVDRTLKALASENQLYTHIGAFRRGQVYGCNTRTVPYYEQTPFHPQWLLRDLACVLHPSLRQRLPGGPTYYTVLR